MRAEKAAMKDERVGKAGVEVAQWGSENKVKTGREEQLEAKKA